MGAVAQLGAEQKKHAESCDHIASFTCWKLFNTFTTQYEYARCKINPEPEYTLGWTLIASRCTDQSADEFWKIALSSCHEASCSTKVDLLVSTRQRLAKHDDVEIFKLHRTIKTPGVIK